MTPAENEIRGAHEVAVQRLEQIRESITELRNQERAALSRIKDCEAAGRLFGITLPPIWEPRLRLSGAPENVRRFALDLLLASPDGIKSPDITAAYKEQFGYELHPKTIGMTLYRIKKEGLAERKGHTWRPIAPVSAPSGSGK